MSASGGDVRLSAQATAFSARGLRRLVWTCPLERGSSGRRWSSRVRNGPCRRRDLGGASLSFEKRPRRTEVGVLVAGSVRRVGSRSTRERDSRVYGRARRPCPTGLVGEQRSGSQTARCRSSTSEQPPRGRPASPPGVTCRHRVSARQAPDRRGHGCCGRTGVCPVGDRTRCSRGPRGREARTLRSRTRQPLCEQHELAPGSPC